MFFWRKKLSPMQKLSIENETSSPMEVWAEMMPDRYILQPGDKMVIEAHQERAIDHFEIIVQEGALVIYSPCGVPDQVFINGKPAEPLHQRPLQA